MQYSAEAHSDISSYLEELISHYYKCALSLMIISQPNTSNISPRHSRTPSGGWGHWPKPMFTFLLPILRCQQPPTQHDGLCTSDTDHKSVRFLYLQSQQIANCAIMNWTKRGHHFCAKIELVFFNNNDTHTTRCNPGTVILHSPSF